MWSPRRSGRRRGGASSRRRGAPCATRARAGTSAASRSGSSPISSRKTVPPSADSMAPARAAWAPVKAPRVVTEELGVEQVLGQRRAVDDDEGPAGARRGVVDGARDELLAGARLALDEHGRAPSARAARASRRARASPRSSRRACRSRHSARSRCSCAASGCSRRRTRSSRARTVPLSGTRAPVTCRPSTNVPLRLPRSRSHSPSCRASSSAWMRETVGFVDDDAGCRSRPDEHLAVDQRGMVAFGVGPGDPRLTARLLRESKRAQPRFLWRGLRVRHRRGAYRKASPGRHPGRRVSSVVVRIELDVDVDLGHVLRCQLQLLRERKGRGLRTILP